MGLGGIRVDEELIKESELINILTFISKTLKKLRELLMYNKNSVKHQTTLSEQVTLLEKDLAEIYDGKLLIRDEIKLSDKQLHLLIDEQIFSKVKAIKKRLFTYECFRCGNMKQSLFGKKPCLTCKRHVTYCRKCLDMGRVKSCHYLYYYSGKPYLWQKQKTPLTWEGQLNPNQLKASHRLLANMKDSKNILVWSVTGSGKTEMIFPVINKILQSGKRICLATPRKDVVQELLPRCQSAFEHTPIQAVYGGSEEKGDKAQFIITTTHQLIRFKHAFDVMIIDEIDAFPYHADTSLPYVTKRSLKKTGMTIYLTATPRLRHRWQMKFKLLDYIFVPSRFHGNPLPVPKIAYLYNLTTYLNRHQVPPLLLNWLIKRESPHRQLLIFVPTIKMATKLLPHLTKSLIKKSLISNKSSISSVHAEDADRAEKVSLFRQKKLTVLITTTILERGVTFPSIDVIVLKACHEVFDEAALIQIAGRAGRSKNDPTGEVIFIHEGKTNALVNAKQSIVEMNKRADHIMEKDDYDDMPLV